MVGGLKGEQNAETARADHEPEARRPPVAGKRTMAMNDGGGERGGQ
jgi:hypothetical protein